MVPLHLALFTGFKLHFSRFPPSFFTSADFRQFFKTYQARGLGGRARIVQPGIQHPRLDITTYNITIICEALLLQKEFERNFVKSLVIFPVSL